jgi:RNA polymerase sigma-70 factor (ECF subfamily)
VSAFVVRPRSHEPLRSDCDLLAAIADGDLGALGELYDRFASDVWRVARRILVSDADAEDVVHAVFMKLPQIAASHDGRSNVRAWLLGICVHVASRQRRSAARFFNMIVSFAQVGSTSTRTDPEQLVSARQELRIFETALAKLSPKKRIAFMLVELEGLTSDEAARALDVPAATVRTRLHHARAELDLALKFRGDDTKGGPRE